MPPENALRSTSLSARVEEMHEAYRDPSCDGMLCVGGGANSWELLRRLDWELIRQNPKIFVGTSDVSAIVTAIHAMTGQIAYYGPNVYRLGATFGAEETFRALWDCLSGDAYSVPTISTYTEEAWEKDPDKTPTVPHPGSIVLQEGYAQGMITGGNIRTLTRIVRTKYMGELDGTILFLESSGATLFTDMTTDLNMIIESARNPTTIRGLVLGTMGVKSEFGDDLVRARAMVAALHEWGLRRDVPVIFGAPFGHISPIALTIPVGGECEIHATSTGSLIRITKH
jgi:muramoyltetrapeptide carboxypeptidase LdcA involved in peptidoglycan recycling